MTETGKLIEQIDALLALDAAGGLSPSLNGIGGLARELLTRSRSALLADRETRGEPVAWRWSFDGDIYSHGAEKPGNFRFGDPDLIEPLYATPQDASERIRQLEAENESLRKALAPFGPYFHTAAVALKRENGNV